MECAKDRGNVEQALVPNVREVAMANLHVLPVRVKAAINKKEEINNYRTVCKRL